MGFNNLITVPLPRIRRRPVRRPGPPVGGIGNRFYEIGGAGNDTINFISQPGPPGAPGPPGPAGNVSPVATTIVTSSPYFVTPTNYFLSVNDPSGFANVVLPASVTGTVFIVKDDSGDALNNPIRITANGAQIDGSTTGIINSDYGSLTFIYNGTQWNVV